MVDRETDKTPSQISNITRMNIPISHENYRQMKWKWVLTSMFHSFNIPPGDVRNHGLKLALLCWLHGTVLLVITTNEIATSSQHECKVTSRELATLALTFVHRGDTPNIFVRSSIDATLQRHLLVHFARFTLSVFRGVRQVGCNKK